MVASGFPHLPSAFSNGFSETIGPISIKSRQKGKEDFTFCPDYMTKMAAMPISGKTFSVYVNDDLGLTLTYLNQGHAL